MNNNINKKIEDINIDEFLSIIFIVLGILGIYGDYIQKEYLKTNNYSYQEKSDNIFKFILLITLIVYLVYLYRNYMSYENCSEENKDLFFTKVLASTFLIIGVLLSLYFQINNKDFIGNPAI